jgi:phage-related protein
MPPTLGRRCPLKSWAQAACRLRLYLLGYNFAVQPWRFLGDSLKCLRNFPDDARHDAGYQHERVQRGDQPDDFKPMPGIGKGVEEIRVSEPSGAYRVVYVARRVEAGYVLHAFHKKTQATPKRDLEIAMRRFGQVLGGRI